jgi:PAS domain S-box-containing protein
MDVSSVLEKKYKMKHKDVKLIILEDEPAHAELISRRLTENQNGCNISIVGSLKEFEQMVDFFQPDLVIADMNLPDGNAFSLLNGSVDSQPWPVLVMTSYGDEELAVKALKSGALDYIVKSPETFKNIKHVINRNIREWRNIKKSRQAETAMRVSEKKFRTLFETMEQGVIYQDATGQIVEANPAAEKILGLTIDEMRNRTSLDPRWKSIHEDGSPFPGDEHPAIIALKRGINVRDAVMGVYHPQKEEYKWIMVNATPQFEENNCVPYQVFTTFTDITELKQTQELLQKQNLELKLAKDKAEESDRLKSAFMANMSHEIRTPMNGILGFADLLKSPNLSGESQQKYIEIIEMSGRRMLDIINDLIDISKIEAGQIEVKEQTFNIVELMDELLDFFTPEARNRQIELKYEIKLDNRIHTLTTDRTKLSQIIINLIKNALKFTSQDGTIEFGCGIKDSEYLQFYVMDNGLGIRKELQTKIFDRFRQGDTAKAEVHEGVGLGLSICKALVEMLGGEIGVESEPGVGSVFYFTIPYENFKNDINPAGESKNFTNNLPCVNVLIAEDDQPSYILLKEILKQNNINSYHVNNGRDAVSMMKEHTDINLVIMDVKMPVMNGIEATQEIKKIKSDIPIIAQSAFVNEIDIKNAIEAGCSDYITKPIKINELLNKIAHYCNFHE